MYIARSVLMCQAPYLKSRTGPNDQQALLKWKSECFIRGLMRCSLSYKWKRCIRLFLGTKLRDVRVFEFDLHRRNHRTKGRIISH